jgi:putative transposase
VKYACIRTHRGRYAIKLMCRLLGVSRSGYYAWHARAPSERARDDAQLRAQIRRIYQRSRGRYGSPRIHAELRATGIRCARKRVARLLRLEGLRARSQRRPPRRRTAAPCRAPAPNRLARCFAPEQVAGADRVWVSDLTYVPTREGWLYLAVVLDLATRAVVGWAMRSRPEAALSIQALRMAQQSRQPAAGLLLHSDQGVQYQAHAYQALLRAHAMQPSMSRRGDCWDNAVAESFFATLEKELLQGADFATRRHARSAIFEFIEIWYNRQRRHSSLGYRTPAEHEAWLARTVRAA